MSENCFNSVAQEQARELARVTLASITNPDLEQITKCCDKARRYIEEDTGKGSVNVEALVDYFLATTNIFVAPMQSMSDQDHVD